MKYKLAKKAYEIDFGRIEEGYLYSQEICFAETLNKAKYELLGVLEGATLVKSDKEINYLNIPVVRFKHADKYFFEGREMNMREIEDELSENKRILALDEILNNPLIKYCYKIKRGYYRPNNCGYTDSKKEAGIYSKEEAVSSAKSCRDVRIETIDIGEHNQMIKDEIQELNTRLLT
ncbi:hypothetical protein LNJ05_12285 [Tenacibaculum finnmarkense genomovar ulcerans]|uniref:hypothetical protein n=1 Tax=Tenacibaculum TaxID=104267 RepID=UPI001E3C5D08|nr:hypothetical protein [Tenacibaculum finnmarkense]MCD8433540.1 hypothetical protein [Tenacibaculum finnmarkense genomovar ulcerans]MCD8445577.1 hypothetical protein [Tenacibaculum finnmarkense genomovar ulcerans]MCG8750501.1 hypothetical protein [Tenacibaculum finnmarkense]MCG8755530.1 hypothetical protein [Tenacibaculum finnmarkense]MCG8784107.1 hypothetical protein [Tenacibaculum finnmarkense]